MSIVEAWFLAWRRRVDEQRRSMKKAKAGWYYDPRGRARYRHWDGSRWTEDTADELPS